MFDVENKISKLVANPAWRAGRKGKKSTKSDTDDDEEEEDDEVASTRRVVSNKPGGRAGTVSKVGAVQNIPQFRVSLGGLDEAKKACRIQMMRIVNEVDAITKDPSLATDESRVEPFLPFRVFKELMPVVERIVLPPAVPLRLEQLQPVSERLYPLLCPDFGELEEAERVSITNLERERPTISRFFRLAKPVGSSTTGTPFNNVDFLRYDTYVTAVHVEVYNGVVSYIETTYSNGLVARHGGKYDPNSTTVHTLQNLGLHERIIAATVETGVVGDPASSGNGQDKDLVQKPSQSRITRLKLYTNRGRSLVAEQAPRVAADQAPRVLDDTDIKPTDMRGRRHFNELTVTHFDPAMDDCYFKGFWGCSKNGLNGALEDGIWRLGVIWGNNLIPEVPISEEDLVDDETKPESGKKDKKVVKK